MKTSLHWRVGAMGPRAGARRLATLGLLSALALCPHRPVAALSPAPRAAVPALAGDMIVKFRDTSDSGAALAAVLGGTLSVDTAAPVALRLSESLGVPLRLVQVTSGREALLAIDRDALQRLLAQRASSEVGIVRATAVPAAGAGLPPDQLLVRLEITPQAVPQSLATKLAAGGLLRLRVHSVSAGSALLSCDIVELTVSLLERIRQQADVEYAQANRLLKPTEAQPPR